MTPLQSFRGIVTLLVAPFMTLVVSVLCLLDVHLLRRSEVKAQIFARCWGQILCQLPGVRVRVEGIEHIDPDSGYVFVANHCSQYDIFTFQGYFPHDFRWIAKKELFRIPFVGQVMSGIGYIAIDRSQGREAVKSLDRAAKRIAQGTSVLIFPEGTRSANGKLQDFKAGAALLAIKAKAPVVPVTFNGSYEVLPKGKILPHKGEVCIRIGRPMNTEHYKNSDKQALTLLLQEKVEELLDPRYHQGYEGEKTTFVKT